MCISPNKLPSGVMVPCQLCWQCMANRKNDWVGRCIAEQKVSFATSSGTLTYGYDMHMDKSPDHLDARKLNYQHVQEYLKRLRRYGAPLRYFVAGEYGSAKGRAHWHIIAFWQERLPENYRENVRYDHFTENGAKLWDRGFTWWEPATIKSIRYVMKYILKDFEIGGDRRYGLSRMPPLGHDYFRLMALQHVAQGLSPQDLRYGFTDTRDRHGDVIEFRLHGAAAYRYLEAFHTEWQMVHKNDRYPQSDLMDEWVDERDRRKRRLAGEPDVPVNYFDLYFQKTLEEKPKWTQPIEGVARDVEQMISQRRFIQSRLPVLSRTGS